MELNDEEYSEAMNSWQGFMVPGFCPRRRSDCASLNLIVSNAADSFFCCGENDGSTREADGDKYTLCFKNALVDQISHNDKRDLVHQQAVISAALAIIEERDSINEKMP